MPWSARQRRYYRANQTRFFLYVLSAPSPGQKDTASRQLRKPITSDRHSWMAPILIVWCCVLQNDVLVRERLHGHLPLCGLCLSDIIMQRSPCPWSCTLLVWAWKNESQPLSERQGLQSLPMYHSSGLHGNFFPRALWNNKDACTCRHALPEGKCRHRQILAGRKRRSPDFAAGWPRCAEQNNRHRACASAVQEAEAEFTEQSALDEDGSVGFILPPSEPLAVIVGGGTCGVLLVGASPPQSFIYVACFRCTVY